MLQASDNSQTRETAATMGKHISRMENYVSSMSNLRRMEDTQPEYKLIGLQPLVSSLYDSAKIVCAKNAKELILQNHIPNSQLPLDSAFVSQVSNNLLANAVRYAQTTVTISFALHDNGLLLSVSDDGKGFGKSSLQKATSPYYTEENNHSEHFGLGLYICKLLCEHHNGYLKIENTATGANVYGKTKCATAKVAAGILTAILTTALVAAFNLLLALIFYGTEGLDCSILFAPSDYVEGFIPFNITCGTLLKYQILLAFTCTLSVTGITLFLSAISKNQIVALVAAIAIFLFPVLLPITEANPLFRLVGLLPIYHALAISLLSVEQMSNGMLYAIWAIPAALLFLGVGAGISRRVFAKHQVS